VNDDGRSFERFVADNVAGAPGGVPMPEDFYDEMYLYASRHRQRPHWLALIKEPPMRISSSVAVGSPMARVVAIMVATLLIAAGVAGAGIAGSRLIAADGTIVVDQSGGGDFTTISDAVANAQDGATVLIKPGRYVESVAVIGKDLTITGDGDRDEIIIEAASTAPPVGFSRSRVPVSTDDPFAWAVLLADTETRLSDLTVIGQQEGTAIPIVGADSAVVLDGIAVRVPGPASGEWGSVHWTDGSGGTLRDSVVEGWVDIADDTDVTIDGNEMPATCIAAWGGGADIVIRDNVIHGCPYEKGIDVDARNNTALIEGNDIWVEDLPADANTDAFSGGRPAIEVHGSGPGSVTIRDNDLHDSGFGIWVSSGQPGLEVSANRIRDNDVGIGGLAGPAVLTANEITGSAQTGIEIRPGLATPELDGNTITGNVTGLSIAAGVAPLLTGNTICDNGTNLNVAASDEPLDTSGNEICDDA
jgi:hypothetical protein